MIPCVSREFAPEYGVQVERPDYPTVTWPEIVHAAITVGRRGWRDVWRHGAYSIFEMFYRSSMVFANLRESENGCIRKTVAYEWLDPSEKSAVSYFLGLTFAKLMATRRLSVHWAMHLDVYAQHLQATLTASDRRRRPDLVGRDTSGRWCVFEAKGSTNRVPPRTIQDAKEQTRAVRTIRGVEPHLRVASITHFVNQTLCVHLEDPDGAKQESFDLDISEAQFMRDYYRPFTDIVDQNRGESLEVDAHKVHVVRVPGCDLRVGLNEEIRKMVTDRTELHLLPRETVSSFDASRNLLLASDGILVELGKIWSPKVMSLEPWDRHG